MNLDVWFITEENADNALNSEVIAWISQENVLATLKVSLIVPNTKA